MNISSSRVGTAVAPQIEGLESRLFFSTGPVSQPGSLDLTFGDHGAAYIKFQRPRDIQTIAAVALPNGKTMMLGSLDSASVLGRLNADGSPDASFNAGGPLFVRTYMREPRALAIDSHQRIYIAGDNGIARFLPNGSIDPTFAGGRQAQISFRFWLFRPNVLALTADDAILVGGSLASPQSSEYGPYDFAIAKFLDNGAPDKSFGYKGVAVAKFRGRTRRVRNSVIHALAIDDQGRIVAAGGDAGAYDIARFNANGSLDKTFGSAGEAAIVEGAQPKYAQNVVGPFFAAMTLRPSDGEIFLTGGVARAGSAASPFRVAAFTSEGLLDTTFGTQGLISVSVLNSRGEALPAQGNGIALLTDGKLLISGSIGRAYTTDSIGLILARFNADGTPDLSFGSALASAPGADPASGVRFIPTTHFYGADGALALDAGLLPQSDGKFILPLNGGPAGPPYDQLSCLRFNADGTPDLSYGLDGVAVVPMTTFDLATPADIVFANPLGSPIYLAMERAREGSITRLSADGTVDSSFIVNRTLDVGLGQRRLDVLGVQADGKILVTQNFAHEIQILRYNRDGSLDLAWGVQGRVSLNGGIDPATTANTRFAVQKALLRPDGSIIVDLNTFFGALYGTYTDTVYLLDSAGAIVASHALPQWSDVPFGTYSLYSDMTLAADGKLVFSTSASPGYPRTGPSTLGVMRLNANDLTYDPTFGNRGRIDLLISPTSEGFEMPNSNLGDAIVTFPDARVLVAGSETDPESGKRLSVIQRLSSSGALDSTFADAGTLHLRTPIVIGAGQLLLQRDGRILIVAHDSRGISWLSRYNSDGSRDVVFGVNGAMQLPRGATIFSLIQTASGEKILAAGSINYRRQIPYGNSSTASATAVWRINL